MKLAVAFLLGLSLCVTAQTPFGRRAPGFSLPDMKMQQHDIQNYRGKVVLIDIMRTDCPHCQTLTAALEQVKAKYGDKVQILSVVNPPDNQPNVQKYIATYKVTTPILFDCGQMAASYLQVGPKNPTVSVPHVFIIDKAGIIRKELSESSGGGLSLDNIIASVEPLLK
jgi:peroxiredoxin